MTHIFDGKLFAEKKAIKLKKKILDLNTKGIFPHLASILIGDDPASRLYVGLKKKAGEKLGIEVDIYYIPENTKKDDLIKLIKMLNGDKNIHGTMIQMPIPGPLSESKDELVNLIDENKDVDGLKENSKFLHPTSKAVMDILQFALAKSTDLQLPITACVVGATGMVGKPLVKELKKLGYNVLEADDKTDNLQGLTLQSDVVISATGVPGLITPEMIKKDAIVIDVGSPKGDFDTRVSDKSSFFTPVPGGVGPVTIISLLENLVANL